MSISTPVPATKKPLPPWIAGALRGVGAAAASAALGAIIVALGHVSTGSLAPYAPIAILLLRAVEGYIDQKRQ